MDRQAVADFYVSATEQGGGEWLHLISECEAIYAQLIEQYHVEPVPNSEPYATAREMFEDIECGHFYVSNLNCEHPIWTPEQNVKFRTVHDILGHSPVKARFNFKGEVAAYLEQSKHHSPLAQRALYTEVIAQTCNYNVYRGRDQRIVLFPDAVIANVEGLIA